MANQPLFAGLVADEYDRPVGSGLIGSRPCYVIDDAGFKRHVEAEQIDRAVLLELRRQMAGHEDIIAEQALKMTGQDDLFSKAIIDNSLKNIDQHFEELMRRGLPDGAREWLGMMGFRIVVNYRGELVKLDQPGMIAEE
ncbi:MAG: hypothetical protein HY784_08055 [Chloroflexi bacterium]|nr:hypothetical protein [Chloroflexota bacterium]